MPIRILLVDDHAMLRDGLRSLLSRAPDLEVVGEAENGLAALDAVHHLQPEVVVMDIGMTGLNGLEATRRLVHGARPPKVVVLSTYDDQRYVLAALEAGAAAYVSKAAAGEELVRAVRAVTRGQRYLSPEVAGPVIQASLATGIPTVATPVAALGDREREVLQLVAEGHTTNDIAGLLHLSPKTIETHRRNLMRKLDLHNVADITRFAIRHGIVHE
ncbi:MAG: response regulator transcription factor [Armatimonadetes bacterium]|nr:response regulator transcription factor [Armatimonadota bacterium]